MNTFPLTPWARANAAIRKKDYDSAIALYKEALFRAEAPLRQWIQFNLRYAELRAQSSRSKEAAQHGAERASIPRDQSVANDGCHDVMHDIRGYFDTHFYVAKYPDIDQAVVDPLEHYCTTGWVEGRDPRSDFSTTTYLEMNPDIAAAGVNPFWHYVVAGKSEGRETRHPDGVKAEILKTLPSLEQMVQQWKKAENPPHSMNTAQVAQLLAERLSQANRGLAISVGHDHYKLISGGIQLCIQREEQLAHDRGVLYLNIHPWQPLPILASETDDPDPLISMVLAGSDVGTCRSSALTRAVNLIDRQLKAPLYVIVHSLLGHALEHVKNLVDLCNERRRFFWLHDFFSLCPSYALQRNNISFCGAPTIESNACALCIYGHERRSHLRRMREFFDNTMLIAIAPSEDAKQFWLSKCEKAKTVVKVLPHMEMLWMNREKPIAKNSNKPISIGFLGGAVYHKGWNVFERLLQALTGDPRFRFFYLGKSEPVLSGIEGIERIQVHVTADDNTAMATAVSDNAIDYVIHWPTCRETFSFTTHEAIVGGAFVLTHPHSGNVAAVVLKTGMGVVLPNEQALLAFFEEGAAGKTVETIRSHRATRICKPRLSDMAIEFLTNERVA